MDLSVFANKLFKYTRGHTCSHILCKIYKVVLETTSVELISQVFMDSDFPFLFFLRLFVF